MSFSVEDVKVNITREKNPQEYLFVQNLSNIHFDAALKVWMKSDAEFWVGDDLSDSNNLFMTELHKGFDDLVFKFKRVKTSGPVVGFLGFYLDVASGYILMSKVKTDDYIPLFDLYKALELKGLTVTPEIMGSLIERFKLDVINFEQLSKELLIAGQGSGGNASIIGRYLRKIEGENITSEVKFDKQELVNIFQYVTQYLYLLKTGGNFVRFDLGKKFINIEKNCPGLGDFIRNFDSVKEGLSEPNFGILKKDYGAYQGTKKDRWTDHRLQALSTMAHVDKNESHVRQLNKTTTMALNLFDITEELDKDVAIEYTMDSYLEGNIKKDSIKKVIETIGAKEYLKGRNLTNLTSGLTNEDTKKEIEDRFKNMVWVDDRKGRFSSKKHSKRKTMVHDDFEKKVRILKKVFKRIDILL